MHSEYELIDALCALPGNVFFKDTTDFRYPGLLADRAFLRHAVHTFIIRHPREVIASHLALNPALSRDEVGIARLYEIYEAVVRAGVPEPVVVDSDDLIDRPAATVGAYCARVGITFQPDALHWEPGEQPGWRRTSRWHDGASAGSGFARRGPDRRFAAEPPVLAGYLRYHLPYYEKLRAHRLAVDDRSANYA